MASNRNSKAPSMLVHFSPILWKSARIRGAGSLNKKDIAKEIQMVEKLMALCDEKEDKRLSMFRNLKIPILEGSKIYTLIYYSK